MSTLAIVMPSALFVAVATFRFVVRHDRAVSRIMLSLVAVIGNGKRAKRAVRLLKMYLDAPDDGHSGAK